MVTLREVIDNFIVEYPPAALAEGEDTDTDPYVLAWKRALADFNRRASRKKYHLIPVVASTDLYALPYDYIKMIVVDLKQTSGYSQNEGGSVIPYSTSGYVETYQVEGSNIRFVPEPVYTVDKDLWYGAGHVITPYEDVVVWEASTLYEVGANIVLDDFIYATCTVEGTSDLTVPMWPTDAGDTVVDGTATWQVVETAYLEMTMDIVYIISIKAKVFMIQNIGATQATGGLRYSLGELTIDRTRQAGFTNKAADDLNDQYLEEVKNYIGHILSISYRQAEVRTEY